jgi:TolB-like protein
MSRTIVLSVGLLLGVGAASASAQDGRAALAVMPFENAGSYGQDKESFEALQLGIPAMLAAELSRNPAVRLVDRSATQKLLAEQDLGARGRVDAATAAKIGKLVGARHMIMGNFVDFYGKFRVNARVVDAETGQILMVVSNDDPKLQDRNDLYRIIQSIRDRISSGLKLPALAADAAGAARARTVPTEALTLYSRALLAEDRGDRAKASEYYQRAIGIYPEFTEAREALSKVKPS